MSLLSRVAKSFAQPFRGDDYGMEQTDKEVYDGLVFTWVVFKIVLYINLLYILLRCIGMFSNVSIDPSLVIGFFLLAVQVTMFFMHENYKIKHKHRTEIASLRKEIEGLKVNS